MNLDGFLERHDDVVLVRVIAARGSTPRDVGAVMAVSGQDQSGTIGGGRLEFDAVFKARELLARGGSEIIDVALGPEIGQCCGGHVTLELTALNSGEARAILSGADLPEVYIFGAGHVGAAIAEACAPLPLRTRLIDERGEFPGEVIIPAETVVRSAAPGSAFVVVTHDHASDFLIVEEALSRNDAAYVGMIGSKTKRAVLEKKLSLAGVSSENLVCPIGAAGLGDKRPEVIAAFVAVEVMSVLRGV